MNQETIRRKFNKYYEDYHHPSLPIVAKEIGISRVYLVDFKNGKRDVSVEVLKKISRFVDKYSKVEC